MSVKRVIVLLGLLPGLWGVSPVLAQSAATPHLALPCAGCHGADGSGQGSVPRIAGSDRQAFVESWSAFRANQRPATIMNRIARGYTDAEVAVLADYFASLR
jgi:sulfide dehydrogenase cytochrome subunit